MQGAGAQAADGTGRDFKWPDAVVVDAEFGVKGAVREADGTDGVCGATLDGAVLLGGQARGGDVDRFFEVRTFQRIGLIENGEDAKVAVGEQAFDGDLCAGKVTFDDDLVEMRLAGGGDFGSGEETAYSLDGGEELGAIVGADDTLAGGKRERLEDARIGNAEQRGLWRRMQGNGAEPRRAEAGVAEDFAHAEFAAAGFDGGGMVVR